MEQSNIQLFNYENKEVRTFERNGLIWFVLNDIETITKHSAIRQVKKYLRDYEIDDVVISDTLGRKQVMNCISESGFYRLMFRSRMPEAEKFTDYVCCEILPTIRKTGGFNSNTKQLQEIATDKQELSKLTTAKNKINKRLRFLRMRIEANEAEIYAPLIDETQSLQIDKQIEQYSLF